MLSNGRTVMFQYMTLTVSSTGHVSDGYQGTQGLCVHGGDWDMSEGDQPYWHLEHEVLLAEAEADICDCAVEEAGGSQHQDQVEVPRKRSLEETVVT